MVLCLIGVSAIALSKPDPETDADIVVEDEGANGKFVAGLCVSLLSAFLFAMANISTR